MYIYNIKYVQGYPFQTSHNRKEQWGGSPAPNMLLVNDLFIKKK